VSKSIQNREIPEQEGVEAEEGGDRSRWRYVIPGKGRRTRT
jgi:hypothetical protein